MTEILNQLGWRYAVKQFTSKPLSDEQVHFVKETLRLAPSSFGLQPWHFVVVDNSETRKKIREKAWNQGQVELASHLVVLCRPEKLEEADVDRFIQSTADTRGTTAESLAGYANVIKGFVKNFSPEQTRYWMEKQIYLALGQMMTSCAVAGIDTCPMEGFDPTAVDEILELPKEGLRSVVLCAIGFRDDSDKYAHAKKVRYPAEQIFSIK